MTLAATGNAGTGIGELTQMTQRPVCQGESGGDERRMRLGKCFVFPSILLAGYKTGHPSRKKPCAINLRRFPSGTSGGGRPADPGSPGKWPSNGDCYWYWQRHRLFIWLAVPLVLLLPVTAFPHYASLHSKRMTTTEHFFHKSFPP